MAVVVGLCSACTSYSFGGRYGEDIYINETTSFLFFGSSGVAHCREEGASLYCVRLGVRDVQTAKAMRQVLGTKPKSGGDSTNSARPPLPSVPVE